MAAPPHNRHDGEVPASLLTLLTLLSLDCFKLPDLAGFPALLRENKPHFVFLQKVAPLRSWRRRLPWVDILSTSLSAPHPAALWPSSPWCLMFR